MEIWALSSAKKHFWHGNCILLLPPGRLLSILGGMWLLLVAVKSSNAEEKPEGWHQAPEERQRPEHGRGRGRCKGPDMWLQQG